MTEATTTLTRAGTASGAGGAGAQVGKPITTDDFEQSFTNLLGGSSALAQNFAMMTLFTPHVNGAIGCAPNISDKRDLAQCMAYADQFKQWAGDNAAGGSFFQRIMIHGMNALLFLWICLAPVVAIVMLITGARGIKIAGAYLLFGAWSQSWFVGASIINFYIQKQLQYEMAMNGGVSKLTYDMLGRFFESMQIKMGLAGDLLASVPLIMMAVMSGSAYALTQVASRWGAKDHYDEKVNNPSLVSSGALANISTMGEHNRHTGVFTRAGVADPTYSLTSSYDNAIQSLNSAKSTAQTEVSTTESQLLSNVTSHSHDVGSGTQFVDAMRNSKSAVDRAAATTVNEIAKTTGISDKTFAGLSNEIASTAVVGISTPNISPIKLGTEIASKLASKEGWTQEKTNAEAQKIATLIQHGRENVATNERAKTFDMSQTDRSIFATGESSTAARQHAEAVKKVQSIDRAYQVAASMRDNGAFGATFNPGQFAHAAALNNMNFDAFRLSLINKMGQKKFDLEYGNAYAAVTSESRGSDFGGDQRDIAKYAALFETASNNSPEEALLMGSVVSGKGLTVHADLTARGYDNLAAEPPVGSANKLHLREVPAGSQKQIQRPKNMTVDAPSAPAPVTDPSMPARAPAPDTAAAARIKNFTPTPATTTEVLLGRDKK